MEEKNKKPLCIPGRPITHLLRTIVGFVDDEEKVLQYCAAVTQIQDCEEIINDSDSDSDDVAQAKESHSIVTDFAITRFSEMSAKDREFCEKHVISEMDADGGSRIVTIRERTKDDLNRVNL